MKIFSQHLLSAVCFAINFRHCLTFISINTGRSEQSYLKFHDKLSKALDLNFPSRDIPCQPDKTENRCITNAWHKTEKWRLSLFINEMKNQCERKSICFETLRFDVECFSSSVRMSKALNHLRAFAFPSRLERNVLHMIPENRKIHSRVEVEGMSVRSFETKTTIKISSSLDLVRWWKLSLCSLNYSKEKGLKVYPE